MEEVALDTTIRLHAMSPSDQAGHSTCACRRAKMAPVAPPDLLMPAPATPVPGPSHDAATLRLSVAPMMDWTESS